MSIGKDQLAHMSDHLRRLVNEQRWDILSS